MTGSTALRKTTPDGPYSYPEPVARLLILGEPGYMDPPARWPDYLALGLTAAHVPDLIRMAGDPALNEADGDSLELWAPVHAWRALGQLRMVETAAPLVRLLAKLQGDDWCVTDLREVFSLIGPAALPVLAAFLDDEDVDELDRSPVAEYIGRIAQDHPVHRDECVALLAGKLAQFEQNGSGLNGFLIWSLLDLGAVDAIDTIRAAFAADRVDLHIAGDVEDAEIALGLRTERETPPPPMISPELAALAATLGLDDGGEGGDDRCSAVPFTPFVRTSPKVGRNEPCPCGSGRKYKKCCLGQFE